MSWTPFFDIDNSNLSESEKQQLKDEVGFRKELLSSLNLISHDLRLLNARFEEAFDTTIDENDV